MKIINNKKKIVNKNDNINIKHDISNEIKQFGTCIDKYGNYEYYYRVREDLINKC